MDDNLILEKLNILDAAKQFVQLLVIKNLSDAESSKKLELAGKHLDHALITLSFDLQRRIDGDERAKKIKISGEIISATEQLRGFGDLSLNKNLHALIEFSENYENNLYEITRGHDILKSRVLMIIAERFC